MEDLNLSYLQENLRYLLKERKMSICKLEKLIGVSPGYLARTFKKNHMPRTDILYNLAKALDVNLEALILEPLYRMEFRTTYILDLFLKTVIEKTEKQELVWKANNEITQHEERKVYKASLDENNELLVVIHNHTIELWMHNLLTDKTDCVCNNLPFYKTGYYNTRLTRLYQLILDEPILADEQIWSVISQYVGVPIGE